MPASSVSRLNDRLIASTAINQRLSALFRIPTAILWNRLEGRPRSPDLTRPLRAEIRDPLWMLARQWQLGEFAGEDAGMPVRARLLAETAELASIALGSQPAKPYDGNAVLEAVVERQAVEPDLMMSLYVGQRWLVRLGKTFGAADPLRDAFTTAYAVPVPTSGDADLATLTLATHRSELLVRMAVGGKGIDGVRVIGDIAAALDGGQQPSDVFAARGIAISAAQQGPLDGLAADFKQAWYEKLFSQPAVGEDAWVARHLEHNFSLTAPAGDGTSTRLIADQYAEGHLDWFSFDVADPVVGDGSVTANAEVVMTFVPTPVRFTGTPNVRWWEFEDARVGFGLTTASKTDLVKLLLAEFGLVFSNDWFILPFSAKVGTLVDTKGIVVTDNFGFNTLVEPTAKRHRDLGLTGSWSMWTLSKRAGGVDARFFLAPALARSLESKPLEEVVFLRDEMANLVWAVEAVIPNPLGGGRDARATAKLLREAIAQAYPPADPAVDVGDDVQLRYQLMGSVPENWIPLVSVRLKGQSAASAFLQGAMPRVPPLAPRRDGANQLILAHNVVLPRGTILAPNPVAQPNLIHEEEISRGGVIVQRTFQQARWHDGSTATWSGRKKQNGRGEGSSGLAFDQVAQRKTGA